MDAVEGLPKEEWRESSLSSNSGASAPFCTYLIGVRVLNALRPNFPILVKNKKGFLGLYGFHPSTLIKSLTFVVSSSIYVFS